MRTVHPSCVERAPIRWQVAGLLAVLGVTASLPAQEVETGRVVQVPAALTTEAINNLSRATDDTLDQFEAAVRDRPAGERPVFKLIYDFTPDGRPANSNDFGARANLVDEIRRVQDRRGARAIAFVHGPVTRHSVLPVLACDEIVFSRAAKLGDVAEPGEVLSRAKRAAYEEVAGTRYPPAVVQKMFDKSISVVKAKAAEPGPRFRAASTLPDDGVVLPAGVIGFYGFEQARGFGLCQPDARETLGDVASAYGLSRAGLEPILARTPVAWLLPVDGQVTPELAERMTRRIRRALAGGANLLIFQLKCRGGDSGAAYDLANFLISLNDERRDNPVKTVAFVDEDASDTALFVALACNSIIMHRKAKLGAFDDFLTANPERQEILRKNLVELAKRQLYSPELAEAFVDPDLRLHWAVKRKGGGEGRPKTAAQIEADAESPNPQWRSDWLLKPNQADDEGRPLTLSADLARKIGLTRDIVEDLNGVYRLEGLEPARVQTAGSDWLDDLANFLRDPWTSMVLVMLGITCLIVEMKLPGVGLPGIVAAVCFVLFFWSHSQLAGQITWLAVLLFLLGLLFLAFEIFILPGFGVFGVSGLLLVIGGLGLVAYGHWPRSTEEWAGLGRTMGPFGLSFLGAILSAAILARYLPNIPYANRLILKGPDGQEEYSDDAAAAGPVNELARLLGAVGVAATTLRPAGKAQFGDQFVDVVAEGSYIPPGTRIRVIEVEGNRVVVKEV